MNQTIRGADLAKKLIQLLLQLIPSLLSVFHVVGVAYVLVEGQEPKWLVVVQEV